MFMFTELQMEAS